MFLSISLSLQVHVIPSNLCSVCLYLFTIYLCPNPSCDLVGLVDVTVECVCHECHGHPQIPILVYQFLEGLDGRREGNGATGQHPVHVKTDPETRLERQT